jgi:O-antigen/teichoic acid export membrane protein
MIDRVALVGFLAVPPLAWALARLTKPELAQTALALGAILATGHGLHATTAPLTAYLSGLRELGPELAYLVLACAVTLVLALPLGAWLGVEGVAVAVAAGLAVGSVWLRRRVARRLERGPGAHG